MDEIATAIDSDSVVVAYRRFRSSDLALHERVRSVTGMGDNELRVVQYLLYARRQRREVKPTEIARHLGISSASTTALLDRLERGGALERLSHPTDRRSILIATTPEAEARLSATVEEYDRRLARVSTELSDDERSAVEKFLAALTEAADSIAAE